MADHPLRFMMRLAVVSDTNVIVSWVFLSNHIYVHKMIIYLLIWTKVYYGCLACVIVGSCSGWSGSHYVTFDGTAYTFTDNCSYILVQEIYNTNLKIILNKETCSSGSSFCPQSLIISYNSQDVILTQTMTSNGATNVVRICYIGIFL